MQHDVRCGRYVCLMDSLPFSGGEFVVAVPRERNVAKHFPHVVWCGDADCNCHPKANVTKIRLQTRKPLMLSLGHSSVDVKHIVLMYAANIALAENKFTRFSADHELFSILRKLFLHCKNAWLPCDRLSFLSKHCTVFPSHCLDWGETWQNNISF